jgi:hypothetical protein
MHYIMKHKLYIYLSLFMSLWITDANAASMNQLKSNWQKKYIEIWSQMPEKQFWFDQLDEVKAKEESRRTYLLLPLLMSH